MDSLVYVLIYAAILGFQYFLSSRSSVYWGAVIPLLFIFGMAWMYLNEQFSSFLAYILIMAVGLLFLLEQWSRGRKKLQKTIQKELDQMKTRDIS